MQEWMPPVKVRIGFLTRLKSISRGFSQISGS